MTGKRSPVLVVMSTLAALQVLVAGSALTDVVGKQLGALLALMVASVQIGLQFYVSGQVTPAGAVVAQVNDAGAIVAGPAAQTTTGAPVEEPVPLEPEAGAGEARLIAIFAAAGLLALVLYHFLAPHL